MKINPYDSIDDLGRTDKCVDCMEKYLRKNKAEESM